MHSAALLAGTYDYRLVALSVVIAICASYAALDLAGRVTAARGYGRALWLGGGGASAMGIGIWSMHYIGMLAFSLPVPVLYHWPTVLLSLFAAIAASSIALYVVSRPTMNYWSAAIASIFMGAAIAAIHLCGHGRDAAQGAGEDVAATSSIRYSGHRFLLGAGNGSSPSSRFMQPTASGEGWPRAIFCRK